MRSVQHFISISGGKDSTATACLAIERMQARSMETRFIFADTGNEHPMTLDYVAYLGEKLGVEVVTVRADFTEWMANIRSNLPKEWGKEKRRTKHRYGCHKKGCDCPVTIFPPIPDDLIARAQAALVPTGNPFLDLCMLKGRFPSRRVQFCTEELKLVPMAALKRPIIDAGTSIVSWIGERAEESPGRARKPQMQRIRYPDTRGVEILYRPIKHWSVNDVFAIAKRHGLKPNPLYQMGMTRVGCMPCVNCSKPELRQIAARFPEQVDRIREWESLVAEVSRRRESTFFPAPMVPGLGNTRASIDRAVAWSRTTRGGKNFDLLANIHASEIDEGAMCESAYGLCE